MSHHSLPVALSHFSVFASNGGYMFNLIATTSHGGSVVVARSFRYRTRKEALDAIELVREQAHRCEIVGPAILLNEFAGPSTAIKE